MTLMMRMFAFSAFCIAFSAVGAPALAQGEAKSPAGPAAAKVSFDKQIRPIFQANCQGCHQPAKAKGGFIMTAHDKMLLAGDSDKKGIVPGKSGESYLYESIVPKDGKARMPEGKKPLDPSEIELIKRWIDEGAVDDTPANARQKVDAEHPPVYTHPPILPSLDFSPDGKLLAVAGFHEVLLIDTSNHTLAGRLVGLSERIQTVRFSPDGGRLAVAGGLPGRMGEIQVWDVAKKKLVLSAPYTFDTLFGLSWSGDGNRIGFGCTDNSVRVIDAKTGEQVMFQGGHSDWVLDTFFVFDNSHVVSASRDMSVKLTEIATQRLIDNVTSITPGALKGGVQALARHPKFNVFIAGGSDGVPRAYRVFRETARQIGDDANLIGDLFPQVGRIFSVRFSPDGKRIASASSLDGKGEIVVASYDHDADVPNNIKQIMGKVAGSRVPAERQALEEYRKKGIREISRIKLDKAGAYAVAFSSDNTTLAVAAGDGLVRLYNSSDGKLIKEFAPAPIQAAAEKANDHPKLTYVKDAKHDAEKLPGNVKVIALEFEPKEISLSSPYQYAQLLITAKLSNGDSFDATRIAKITPPANVGTVTPSGLVRPIGDGQGDITIELAGQAARMLLTVTGQKAAYTADFIHDVNPVLGRLGCNAGTCHGANKGKNGFKLSLRGVDPILDVRSFLDDHAGRRANIASPDDSLMLLKPSGGVAHVGGQLTKPGEPYYELIRNWIAHGAQLNLKTPKVTKIEIQPANPIAQRIGEKQQFRVLATYADGKVKDVTRESFVEAGNIELASADNTGLITALRRGEVPILARYEGAYAATTMLVMGDRSGFAWKDPPAYNRIDELTAAKWKRMKIEPSDVCSDLDFLRRVYLDLTGVPPTADDVRAFMADNRESRQKREAIVDKLIGSSEYVDYWTNKWADLLTVNRKYLGTEGASMFRDWIRKEVDANTPYDAFARKILTASGSNKDNPPASYFKVLRDPANTMENTTHLFLGIRFNCNKCHDHPFERWTQDQYYSTAAYFAQVAIKGDPASGKRTVGGTAVVGGNPLFEIISDKTDGDVIHERTNQKAAPEFPFVAKHDVDPKEPRRQELAKWMTSPDNAYFAKSYVNRVWGYLFGTGIIDPIDDIRAGNPPTNPELLDYLTQEFVKSGFNVRHLQKLIVTSRTYQLAVSTNKWNADDKTNYSHAIPRRLPAETLYDALIRVTGAKAQLGRAASLPDSGVDLPSGFLATFGRPSRDSACECERTAGVQMGPVMALVNGATIADAIGDPNNELAKLVQKQPDDRKLVDEIFLRILNRPATAKEIDTCLNELKSIDADHAKLTEALRKREIEAAEIRKKKEAERETAMAKAKADLEAYQKEIAPRVAKQEAARKEAIEKALAAFNEYEKALPKYLGDWEKKHATDVEWHTLLPQKAEGIAGGKLTVMPDRSIVASGGKNERDTYTITYRTTLKNLSAVRLEVLADPTLPKKGPGRAPADGNFVLTEFQVLVQPVGSKDLPKKIPLTTPLADFSQDNFDVRFAVDGDEGNRDRGWAVSPQTGHTHWATFQLKDEISIDAGAIITVRLVHNFNQNNFNLGRFRVSFAAHKAPVGLSLADDYRSILQTPAAERTKEQNETIFAYFKKIDPGIRDRQKALADAQRPLPVDPKLVELQSTLTDVSRPVPEDERLVQLRNDAKMSEAQLSNRRLTAAQDISWALINSPAFLFNH
jgi:WD40 repeat protein/mono/diheme cytochrome c family protein